MTDAMMVVPRHVFAPFADALEPLPGFMGVDVDRIRVRLTPDALPAD